MYAADNMPEEFCTCFDHLIYYDVLCCVMLCRIIVYHIIVCCSIVQYIIIL